MVRIIVLLFVAIAACVACSAQDLSAVHDAVADQDTTKVWKVEVNDGNEFIGKIKTVQDGKMILRTEKFGSITIWMADIRTIDEVEAGKAVVSSRDNFHSTHYLFMPNGFGLKRGEVYYQNVWVMVNQFNLGITNNISVSMGTFPLYLFGADAFPFWIAPKVSLPLGPRASLGAGVMYFHTFNPNNDAGGGGGGVAYSTLTLGTRDKNTSIGFGYGFSGSDFSRRPAFTLSNMTRVGPRAYFITENYVFISEGDTFGLISAGGRRVINRLALDFGGFIPVGGGLERFIIVPWLGLSVPLGKRH